MVFSGRRTRSRGHYIEFFLPFYLLLSQYSFSVINIGMLGLAIVAVVTIVNNGFKFTWRREYREFLVFLIYVVFRDIINIFLGSSAISAQINRILEYLLVYVLVFFVCSKSFSEDTLYKTWKFAGFVYSAGLLYHLVMIYIFGKSILPIAILPDIFIQNDQFYLLMTRPESFFVEPTGFAGALLPLEFLALKRKNYKVAVLTTLFIFASTSTVGVVLSAILWGCTLLSADISKVKKVGLMLLGGLMCVAFISLPMFEESLEKLVDAVHGGSTVGSRIVCGFEVVGTQTPLSLITGTTFNEVKDYIELNISKFSEDSIVMIYYKNKGTVFLNTFSQLIFKYGIMGLLLFLRIFVSKFKNRRYEAKSFIAMYLVSIFAQSALLNALFFETVIIILLYSIRAEDIRKRGYTYEIQHVDTKNTSANIVHEVEAITE